MEEDEGVEVEGIERERSIKRTGRTRRGGSRWEDMAVRGGEV